ncbi:Protein FD [Bienertia sinuspersici]
MEEVWKDIHQSCIHQENNNNNNNPRIARGFFEDILNNRPPIIPQSQSEKENNNNNNIQHNHDYDYDYDDVDEDDKNGIFKKELLSNVISTPGFISSLNSPFEALATNTIVATSTSPASSLLNPSCFPIISNKRPLPEVYHDVIDGEPGVDRRHKRMIKNRESAARSRARRQAYTSELEREQAQLKEENAMLRKQQEQVIYY